VLPESAHKETLKKEYRPETEAEKLHTKMPKSTAFTIGGTLALSAVIALSMSFSHFQKKEKAEFEQATKASTTTSPKGQSDLDDKINANPNFEFSQFNGKPGHSAKKAATDEDLADLAATNYPVVKIKKGHIKGTGLKYLSKLDLEWLEIRNPQFDCKNVKYLKTFKCLKKYVMSVPELQDANLKDLADVKTLEDITITVGDITDKGVTYLTKLPNLKRLEISRCPKVSAEIGKKVATMKKLEYFTLPRMQSQSSLKAIANSNIKNIGLNELYLSGTDLKKICETLKPETLCLSNMTITDNDYSGLEKLSDLKKINLTYNLRFPPALLNALSCLNVPEIDFTESRIEPKQLAILLNNPHLQKLTCNFCYRLGNDDTENFVRLYKQKWKRDVQAIKLDFDPKELKNIEARPFEIDIP
jgi:hypothetical protein